MTTFFSIAGDTSNSNNMQSPFLLPHNLKVIEVLFLSEPDEEMIVHDIRESGDRIFICITAVDDSRSRLSPICQMLHSNRKRRRREQHAEFEEEAFDEEKERCTKSIAVGIQKDHPQHQPQSFAVVLGDCHSISYWWELASVFGMSLEDEFSFSQEVVRGLLT
ncbi:hypothetical protein BLNAU_25039 [Blattamonas nauphoetae]|uniref:Uncharacterized protein n=1 Tax=Blattamonas nauphoetae TaxID=2049346 RepID=A0ABQ9WKQ9_9EUKA|nr:hypothetical protein BLNAU_25039 [Blattamonas nauphoetae]